MNSTESNIRAAAASLRVTAVHALYGIAAVTAMLLVLVLARTDIERASSDAASSVPLSHSAEAGTILPTPSARPITTALPCLPRATYPCRS
jgi:hypothetical protein